MPRVASTLGSRVRELVLEYHDGNILRAAEALQIPRRTLAYIADDTTENPRVATIKRIAEYYGVRVEWLLTGEGPKELHRREGVIRLTSAAHLALLDAMRRAEVSGEVQEAYVRAAWTLGVAMRVLVDPEQSRLTEPEARRVMKALRIADTVEEQVFAWARFCHALVDTIGAEEARRRLTALAPYTSNLAGEYAPEWSRSGANILAGIAAAK